MNSLGQEARTLDKSVIISLVLPSSFRRKRFVGWKQKAVQMEENFIDGLP